MRRRMNDVKDLSEVKCKCGRPIGDSVLQAVNQSQFASLKFIQKQSAPVADLGGMNKPAYPRIPRKKPVRRCVHCKESFDIETIRVLNCEHHACESCIIKYVRKSYFAVDC